MRVDDDDDDDDDDVAVAVAVAVVVVVVVAAVNDTVAGTGSPLDCSFSVMVRLALVSSSLNGSQNNRLA